MNYQDGGSTTARDDSPEHGKGGPVTKRNCYWRAAVLVLPIAVAASACGSDGQDWSALGGEDTEAAVRTVPAAGADLADPAQPLRVSAADGSTLSDVVAMDSQGRVLDGTLAADGESWHSPDGGLAAGERYTVRVATVDAKGRYGTRALRFRTAEPKTRLGVEVQPKAGSTVGVGQPVVVELDRPVKDVAARRTVEAGLRVTSSAPGVRGAWHWVDSETLHYRPSQYWPAHSRVTVGSALDGVRITPGLHGAAMKPVSFEVGAKVVATVDAGSHYMSVRRDGKQLRSIPITAGKPGFSTRNGVKVVLGKESYVRMRGTSVGISANSSESYDLPVYWATRVTWSGEYLHAAPWSVGSQGVTNASHGCVGMGTANARWFFNQVREGDVVNVVGSAGNTMEKFGNGFGDWNVPWSVWTAGSALHGGKGAVDAKPAPVTLRPSV
jgi:lipoprotein-anchoring transpeptidase ErfK/SrfK